MPSLADAFLIAIVVLLILTAAKLPQMGDALGNALRRKSKKKDEVEEGS